MLCWCGSGIKYKKCHLNRDTQEPIQKGKIFKQLNSFYDQKFCSAPDSIKHECTKKIIKAHSISKSSSLKAIAKDGHVLTTFGSTVYSENNFKIELKRIGINQASTFTGFCSFHDSSLFSPIENKDFEITELNCFLVAYRAIAREFFVKERVSDIFDLIKNSDKGKSLSEQKGIQSLYRYFNSNNDLTKGDLKYIKEKFDSCLESKEFSSINHIVFTLKSVPKVMTSAVVGPTVDFQGRLIQTFSNNPSQIPDNLIINAFSSNGIGYIVLSWLETHKKSCINLYQSLMKTDSPSDSLTLFIFAMVENIYLSEDWWFHLEENNRKTLINTFSQGITTPTYNDVLITKNIFGAFNIIKTTLLGFIHATL